MFLSRALILALLASAAWTPVLAQPTAAEGDPEPAEAAPPASTADSGDDPLDEELDDAFEVEEVVVTGARPRGSVIGDIEPEITLDRRDIRALGAGSLNELLEALAPQIASGRGREAGPPVTLLNGKRISGFSEIRGIPPEAIERLEILPEEVALKYGYRADQRVVNIVLRQRFRATTAAAGGGFATAGGREQSELDLNHLRINRDNRWIFDLEHRHSEALLESERDIVRATGARFDLAGNVTGVGAGGEIPTLSALVGAPVTIAGVPASAATGAPALDAFVPTAGMANVTDLRPYRTLSGGSDQLSLNATISRPMFGDIATTLNARLETSRSESLIGLPSATFAVPGFSPFSPFGSDVLLHRFVSDLGPLTRRTEGGTAHLGLAMNGDISEDWRWSLTANLDRVESLTLTDTGIEPAAAQNRLDAGDPALNPFAALPRALLVARGQDRAESVRRTANAELVVNGALYALPAGDVSTTVSGQLESFALASETLRGSLFNEADLSRERGGLQANLDIPLASRRREVLRPLGDLTLNANLEVDQLSDFGTLTSLGYGLNWSPIEKVTVIASMTQEDGAPSIQQLGDPVIFTPLVPVFDFVRGETVEVTRVDGGNPELRADSRRAMRLGLTVKPFDEHDLRLSLDYNRSRIEDPIAGFPAVTAEIEAAFPGRFARDAAGRLTAVDARPVNFARSEREDVRWGVNYSKALRRPEAGRGQGVRGAAAGAPGAVQPVAPGAETPPPTSEGAQRRRREGRGGGGFRPGGGFGGRGGFGGPGQGRLQFALYHTIRLEDSILIREGLPELDLLDGAALSARGGRPEHEVELQAGVSRSGLGARLEGRWQSATFVRGPATDGSGDLFFSDLPTLNLRLFADLGQQRRLVERHEWLRGARVTLAINNLFDARPEVRDVTGATPASYQPDRLDPVGRTIRLSVRKLFIGRRPGGFGRDRAPGPGG